jgi:hypothetical protein
MSPHAGDILSSGKGCTRSDVVLLAHGDGVTMFTVAGVT